MTHDDYHFVTLQGFRLFYLVFLPFLLSTIYAYLFDIKNKLLLCVRGTINNCQSYKEHINGQTYR